MSIQVKRVGYSLQQNCTATPISPEHLLHQRFGNLRDGRLRLGAGPRQLRRPLAAAQLPRQRQLRLNQLGNLGLCQLQRTRQRRLGHLKRTIKTERGLRSDQMDKLAG